MRRWALSSRRIDLASSGLAIIPHWARGPPFLRRSAIPASAMRCLSGSFPVARATASSLKWDPRIHAITHPFFRSSGRLGDPVIHQCSSPNGCSVFTSIGSTYGFFGGGVGMALLCLFNGSRVLSAAGVLCGGCGDEPCLGVKGKSRVGWLPTDSGSQCCIPELFCMSFGFS